jgi:putative intracellular protease/amidase
MSSLRKVHVFLIDQFADWEPSYALAEIRRSLPSRPASYEVKTVALSLDPVTSMGGLRVLPDLTLSQLQTRGSSLLILPGSDAWAAPAYDPALMKAKEFISAGVPIAAICGATLGLARAGLLDTRLHTSNAREYLAPTGYRGQQHYRDEPVVEDGGVITASGLAPLEFARTILARLQVYPAAAIMAWYNLYKTQKPEYYAQLTEALAK